MEALLKSFADAIEKAKNPRGPFKLFGKEFKEGDLVSGTWVDWDGRAYHTEGKIVFYGATGLWVESSGGITEVKRFWTMLHRDQNGAVCDARDGEGSTGR